MQRAISTRNLRASEMMQMCRAAGEPVCVTDDGQDDMVVMSKEEYNKKFAILDIYEKLDTSEELVSRGMVYDARDVLKELREKHNV